MNKNQICILVIESDTDGLQEIVKILNATSNNLFIDTAEDTDSALLKIIEMNPDLVLIEYPTIGKTGAGIIKFIQSKLSHTIIAFIAPSKDYAVEAIHHEVYDYLLKPIKKVELERLLEKVLVKKNNNTELRIKELIENQQPDMRLGFNTVKGYIVINPENILYCKADGAFTEMHFINKSTELTFLFLSKVEEILYPYNFVRISRSVIVNRNFIRKVYLKTNTIALIVNGEELEIQGSRQPVRALGKSYLD